LFYFFINILIFNFTQHHFVKKKKIEKKEKRKKGKEKREKKKGKKKGKRKKSWIQLKTRVIFSKFNNCVNFIKF
jgi:hypothetical protein